MCDLLRDFEWYAIVFASFRRSFVVSKSRSKFFLSYATQTKILTSSRHNKGNCLKSLIAQNVASQRNKGAPELIFSRLHDPIFPNENSDICETNFRDN